MNHTEKRGAHWSCMVANERSADPFYQQNWQDLADKKFILFAASRLVAGKIREEAHEHSDAILLVGSKDNVL